MERRFWILENLGGGIFGGGELLNRGLEKKSQSNILGIDIIIKYGIINCEILIKLSLGQEFSMNYPNKDDIYFHPELKEVIFLKNIITDPNISVGDYTYHHSFDDPLAFEKHVRYNFMNDKLIIGKFCAIAHGIRFLMNGANHKTEGFSTYPFLICPGSWSEKMSLEDLPNKGNITIGNDVWLGMNVTIMSGVTIGDGAIVGTRSLVTKDVPPYTVVGGNPATIIRQRFSDKVIAQLLELKWWDWDIQKITDNIPFLFNYDEEKLQELIDRENVISLTKKVLQELGFNSHS